MLYYVAAERDFGQVIIEGRLAVRVRVIPDDQEFGSVDPVDLFGPGVLYSFDGLDLGVVKVMGQDPLDAADWFVENAGIEGQVSHLEVNLWGEDLTYARINQAPYWALIEVVP